MSNQLSTAEVIVAIILAELSGRSLLDGIDPEIKLEMAQELVAKAQAVLNGGLGIDNLSSFYTLEALQKEIEE